MAGGRPPANGARTYDRRSAGGAHAAGRGGRAARRERTQRLYRYRRAERGAGVTDIDLSLEQISPSEAPGGTYRRLRTGN